MLFRVFAAVVLCLLFMQPAMACKYEPVKEEEALAKAEKAFIGTVKTVENRLAVISVEKAVKGVKEGETVDVEISEESCAIRFQPGQRWLYLGPDLPSGSLMLQDEYGRDVGDNAKTIKEKLKLAVDGGDIVTGTAERSCAPWDGAAVALTLDNGITGFVYSSLAQGTEVRTYPADGKPERDHGSITKCPRSTERTMGSQPCEQWQGKISIGSFDGKTVTGNIETEDGENHSLYVFKLQWLTKQVFCG